MDEIVLHSDGNRYWAGDTMFSISRYGRFGQMSRWVIRFFGEATRQWVEDVCPDLVGLHFATLREAREYLQALFEVAPPPMEPVLPVNRLRRAGPGRYLATVTGREVEILRTENRGKKYWVVCGEEGLFHSLWEIRYLLGRNLS